MKKLFPIIGLSLFLASCTSAPIQAQTTKNSLKNDEYTISTDIFDTLQRPLSFQLSSKCKPISRLCWEYHMAGIGWWDIYLMTGKKLGNGIYEKSIANKSNCQIIELHSTKNEYDNSVLMVELIFVSSDKTTLQKIQSDFEIEAINFTGRQTTNENEEIKNWSAGWINYTSYPIQYHESGKWIYIVSSFDTANSPY